MMTVKEASRLTGISIRTLQYYDKLGLLPAMRTESGYRLYDDAALERLQQILLFRELEFPLRDIRTILDNPNFDRRKALRQQIELLTLKKQHLEDLIRLARTLQAAGGHALTSTPAAPRNLGATPPPTASLSRTPPDARCRRAAI